MTRPGTLYVSIVDFECTVRGSRGKGKGGRGTAENVHHLSSPSSSFLWLRGEGYCKSKLKSDFPFFLAWRHDSPHMLPYPRHSCLWQMIFKFFNWSCTDSWKKEPTSDQKWLPLIICMFIFERTGCERSVYKGSSPLTPQSGVSTASQEISSSFMTFFIYSFRNKSLHSSEQKRLDDMYQLCTETNLAHSLSRS